MKVARKPRRFAPLTLLFISVSVSVPLLVQQSVARSNARRLLSRHIAQELEPLCLALLPDEDSLVIAASPPDTITGNASNRGLWTVDCVNARGEPRLHLLWQEERQQVIWLSRFVLPNSPQAMQPVTKETIGRLQAVEMARSWAGRLGMAQDGEARNCAYTVQRTITAWCVHLSLPVGKTSVCIDARSGDIQVAYVRSACLLADCDLKQA